MTAQQLALAVDVGDDRATVALITDRLLHELAHELATPPTPDDDLEVRCHGHLVAGSRLLLAWLDGRTLLPDWMEWPCSACLAEPGQACDIPNRYRRDGWLPEDRDDIHHLSRGLDGRWSNLAVSS